MIFNWSDWYFANVPCVAFGLGLKKGDKKIQLGYIPKNAVHYAKQTFVKQVQLDIQTRSKAL